MAQDAISTLSIFVNAQVGGAIDSLSALEKAAVKLGPAFERSIKETAGSVDVFDAKLKKMALGFARGNYGPSVQKQIDQIRAYYTALQGEVDKFKLRDPEFDANDFKDKLKTRLNILNAAQVGMDKFGVKSTDQSQSGIVKNSEEDKQLRWLAIAQSKADRRAKQAAQDEKTAEERRSLELDTRRKQEMRIATARSLDDKVDEDLYLSQKRSPSQFRLNQLALKNAEDDEARRKQQLRIDTARALDDKIDEDLYLSQKRSPSNRRMNELANVRLSQEERERQAEITREEELDRARRAGELDSIRQRQRDMRVGISGSGVRMDALTDPMLTLRPGDDPRLNTQLGLAQTQHVVNRPVEQTTLASEVERKPVVSNFKVKVDDLALDQLVKYQGRLQNAIKLTDPADIQRLERYQQLLGETERRIDQVQAAGTVPLKFTNEKELERYVAGLRKLERNLSMAESEGKDVALSLKQVRDEIGRINATPVKDLFRDDAGPRGKGNLNQNGLRLGAGSETRNFRFVSQQLAFGADDFMQTYQLGGLKSGMRAMSNNLTAIAGLAIPNPALAAGAVVGISAMSAALPPLVDWLTALSTGASDLEKINAELARIKELASLDATLKILVDDSDLQGLDAYIKRLENKKIVLRIEREMLIDKFNQFQTEANKIASQDEKIPTATEAAFADMRGLTYELIGDIGGFLGLDSIQAQGDEASQTAYSIADERRKYLEAQKNGDALLPQLDKVIQDSKEIDERIEIAKPRVAEFSDKEVKLDRSDSTFDRERRDFMESLKARDAELRQNSSEAAANDQASLSTVTKETTERLETFKETIAVVTPVVDQFVRSFDNSSTTTFNKTTNLLPEVPTTINQLATNEPNQPTVASDVASNFSFSGIASVPIPRLPSNDEVADTNRLAAEAIETKRMNQEEDILAEYHSSMAEQSLKSKKDFVDRKQDYMFDYRYDRNSGQVSGEGIKYLKGTTDNERDSVRVEVEALKSKVYADAKQTVLNRREPEQRFVGTRRHGVDEDYRPQGLSDLSPAIPIRDYMGGDGADLIKVGTPQFEEKIRPVAGTLAPMRLPETVVEFTRKVDEFYDNHLLRKEEEIKSSVPGISFDKLQERMEPYRIRVNEDRDAAIKQHTTTYETAEKRIKAEQETANRLRSSLLSTVDPRRKLEEDFLARNKSILENRAITNEKRGELLELSKEAFNINAGQMDRFQPKPINQGIDVGSRADAELKQNLMGYGDTRSLAIQQLIADHLAEMKEKAETTNQLLKKNKTQGATL